MDTTLSYPTCIKEKGACLLEDGGEPWAYMEDQADGGLREGEDWSFIDENLEKHDQSLKTVVPTKKSRQTKKTPYSHRKSDEG
ncbi:MAG: hypothetical protein RBG13Loki_0353 [Promethearchaeota archaeon CR_4]|nr:MAG: hypothetical protein RBG13Loki_0353 [Candidatus Lokiarchaeota archaeon CR_4]